MRIDEFSLPDGSFSTADITRFLLFGFDIVLSPPPAVDLSTAVLFTATQKGRVSNSATRKGQISNGVTQKGRISITQEKGGNR